VARRDPEKGITELVMATLKGGRDARKVRRQFVLPFGSIDAIWAGTLYRDTTSMISPKALIPAQVQRQTSGMAKRQLSDEPPALQ
jgi:hypothetical protein